MKVYPSEFEGGGLVNSAINKLPVELHIPGYNYCGPGTKLQQRLIRGDNGINGLDEACKEHDIAYSQNKNVQMRHEADKILAKKAMNRVRAGNASLGERIAALGVAGVMKAKVKLGMGLSSGAKKISGKCTVADLRKSTKFLQRALAILENCSQSIGNKQPTKNRKRKSKIATEKKQKIRESIQNAYEKEMQKKINERNLHEDQTFAEQMVAEEEEKNPKSLKRKFDFEPVGHEEEEEEEEDVIFQPNKKINLEDESLYNVAGDIVKSRGIKRRPDLPAVDDMDEMFSAKKQKFL
jgi:flagellar biosynthesis GTPase FlhF